jgi:hypothetical protein
MMLGPTGRLPFEPAMTRTTQQVLRDQEQQAAADRQRPRNPMPEGLPPLHQVQWLCWGWHDTCARTRQKFYGAKFEYSPGEVAAIADAMLTEPAASMEHNAMVTKNDAFPSRFLKCSDLKGQPLVLTIAKAPRETLKYQGREESKVVLHFEGTSKALPLNLTNWDNVVAATGEADSDDWPGHRIECFPTTTMMQGETKDCIRIRKPTSTPKKAKAKKAAEPAPSEMNDEIPF